ncbi:uncharacterized protein L199_006068 [Kwoniella botswanensis]|uniref:uncharacterized protein n=1 Tax=Kwoniella botswanensis TaxID=1268659 RepID=UPI00315D5003
MAELTPPSSHNSTPVRPPADELPPPSPTAGLGTRSHHPLMKSTSMDVDDHLSDTDSSGSTGEIVQGEDGEDELEAREEGDEIMGSSSGEDELEPGQVPLSEEGGKGKGKETREGGMRRGKLRNKRSRKQQPRSTAQGSLMTSSKLSRGGGGGKKDGDLWESEIVDRWNIEIGDVCSDDIVATSSNPIVSSQSQLIPA